MAVAGWGLVDDAKDLQTCDDLGVLGGLALGVIEVHRDGADGVCDFVSKGPHMVGG